MSKSTRPGKISSTINRLQHAISILEDIRENGADKSFVVEEMNAQGLSALEKLGVIELFDDNRAFVTVDENLERPMMMGVVRS